LCAHLPSYVNWFLTDRIRTYIIGTHTLGTLMVQATLCYNNWSWNGGQN